MNIAKYITRPYMQVGNPRIAWHPPAALQVFAVNSEIVRYPENKTPMAEIALIALRFLLILKTHQIFDRLKIFNFHHVSFSKL